MLTGPFPPLGIRKNLTSNFEEYLNNVKILYCKIHLKTAGDLASTINMISSIAKGKINDNIVENNSLSIEIYKSQVIEQDYCMEIYPIDYKHNEYEIFIKELKNLIDELKKHKITFAIEINEY